MEVQEFDNALTELETRVDRLRALYENWFRGYEKTEPSVARKDVERRVYGLRKELPRNTALRFRYHQLYQRFCTFTNYWQRTGRQVEEGTYRMQVQRMRRRKDEQLARSMVPRAGEGAEDEGPQHKSYELNLDETLDVGSLLDDFELDQVANAIDAPGPYAEPQTTRPVARFRLPGAAPSKGPPERPSLTLEALQSFGGIPAIMAPPAANDSQSTKPPLRGSLPMATLPAPRRPSAEEQVTGRPPPSITARANEAATLEERLSAASQAQRHSAAGAGEPAVQPKGELHGRVPQPANAAPARPAAGQGVMPVRPAMPAPLPPGRPSMANSPAAAATGARPAVPAPPAATAAARPPVPPPPPRVPAPPVPSQASAPRAPAPAAPPVAQRPPAASAGAISDQQIRRIYDDYVAARRKNNEGDVRYETLASSINKMLPDLQKRHQGKRIDFEVVLKDGRVGLKPKAT
jgi:hypothetical protein